MAEKFVFQNVKACLFDAYGTLFDFNSAVGKHRERLGAVADQVSALWRTKQLEYTWQRSLMRCYAPFWQVTQDGLDYALDAFGVSDRKLRNDLIKTYLKLDCYPDVKASLNTLRKHGVQLAILSNGTPAMLEAAVKSSGLKKLIDPLLSVEEVGIYKPDPRVYRLATKRLKLKARQIVFLSAKCLGRRGRRQCRPACRLDQPLQSAPGAIALATGCGNQVAGGSSGPARFLRDFES
jgi:2-haloacid dehalogenase